MGGFSELGWLQGLKLPLRVTLALAMASSAVLLLDRAGSLDLSVFGTAASPIVVVTLILSAALSLTSIVSVGWDQIVAFRRAKRDARLLEDQSRRSKEEREAIEQVALKRLDFLTPEELHHLAECLRNNSQSFYAYAYSPSVSTLGGKGLVNTPGGMHHQDHYPYTIEDFVWTVLLARKQEFIERDDANMARVRRRR